MSKFAFLAKCISSLNYKRLFQRAKEIADKNNKSATGVLFDMIYCGIKYQAGYEDYVLFDFVNLTAKQRATYMTRGSNNQIVKKYNDRTDQTLQNKILFHQAFNDFTKRSYINVETASYDEFEKWAKDKDDFIIKPISEGCGKGVEKIKVKNYDNLNQIYNYIRSTNSVLAEDTVQQNEKMSAIYPDAINTIRIVTIFDKEKDKVYFPFTSIRIGNGGVVDNINHGGMSSVVDPETGIIIYPAADKTHKVYDKHPITGTKITGFQIPYWNEILDFAAKAAKRIPSIGYVGWDIGITKDGLCMIEGNDYPGHDIYQMPGMVKEKTGMKPVFEKITGLKL